jgi:hypothetical protein
MPKNNIKFKFTTEYQWDLLRYTVQDKNGEKALNKYDDDYFTLIPHQVIAYALKSFYKKNRRIPGETILREQIVQLLNSKQYLNLVILYKRINVSLLNFLLSLYVFTHTSMYNLHICPLF